MALVYIVILLSLGIFFSWYISFRQRYYEAIKLGHKGQTRFPLGDDIKLLNGGLKEEILDKLLQQDLIIWVGTKHNSIYTSNPTFIKQMYLATLNRHPSLTIAGESVLPGFFSMEPETSWTLHRQIFGKLISNIALNDQYDVGKKIALQYLKTVPSATETETKDFSICYAFDIVCKVLFDFQFQTRKDILHFNRTLDVLKHEGFKRYSLLNFLPSWIVTRINSSLVQQKQKEANLTFESIIASPVDRSLLKRDLLEAEREGVLSKSDMQKQIKNILFVGPDAIYNTLPFLLNEIGRNPTIQEKLYNECILLVNPSKYGQIHALSYLDAVVKEVLRKWPVATFLTRYTKEQQTINGLDIPKNTYLTVPIKSIHHNPKYWESPLTFNPNRFLDNNSSLDAFIPFGLGVRNCLGKHVALFALKIMVYHVSVAYKIDATMAGELLQPHVEPEGPCPVKFIPRQ